MAHEGAEYSPVTWGSPEGRGVLLATVLASSIAFLDASVVNVALPTIGTALGTSVGGLQWIVSAYAVTLTSLIPIAGSLSDRFGRRRVLLVGVVWFAAASLLCGIAPTWPALVVARALQGIGGALLTPGSLAILQASFAERDRGRAVGAWSGWSGVASALAPFVGGGLIAVSSWRLIFLINLPVAAAVIVLARRYVPETRDRSAGPGIDIAGALLAVVGLAGLTLALISGGEGSATATVRWSSAVGVMGLVGFVVAERVVQHPMVPLELFKSRQFTAVNIVTFSVYASLSVTFFLLVIYFQQVLGYSPVWAGAATLPVTGLMLGLSARAGQLSDRIGPRVPMTSGPLGMAVGLALLSSVETGASYVSGILPGLLLLGVGLSLTVAPLTATVMAAAPARHAGIASGVNNAVSRGAGLLAVAVLPGLTGLTGDAYHDPAAFAKGFGMAMQVSAALSAIGGLLAWALIRNRPSDRTKTFSGDHPDRRRYCALDSAPWAIACDSARVQESSAQSAWTGPS